MTTAQNTTTQNAAPMTQAQIEAKSKADRQYILNALIRGAKHLAKNPYVQSENVKTNRLPIGVWLFGDSENGEFCIALELLQDHTAEQIAEVIAEIKPIDGIKVVTENIDHKDTKAVTGFLMEVQSKRSDGNRALDKPYDKAKIWVMDILAKTSKKGKTRVAPSWLKQ